MKPPARSRARRARRGAPPQIGAPGCAFAAAHRKALALSVAGVAAGGGGLAAGAANVHLAGLSQVVGPWARAGQSFGAFGSRSGRSRRRGRAAPTAKSTPRECRGWWVRSPKRNCRAGTRCNVSSIRRGVTAVGPSCALGIGSLEGLVARGRGLIYVAGVTAGGPRLREEVPGEGSRNLVFGRSRSGFWEHRFWTSPAKPPGTSGEAPPGDPGEASGNLQLLDERALLRRG